MTDLIINSAPGVYSFTREQVRVLSASAPIIAGVVFESERGPVNVPTLITSVDSFIQIFGPPNPAISLAHESIIEFLRTGASIYAIRVDNGAVYSGSTLFSTSNFNEGRDTDSVVSFFPDATIARPEPSLNGNDTIGNNTFTLKLDGTMTGGNIAITVSPGNSEADIAVSTAFATDTETTVSAFADDLREALTGLSASTTVVLIPNAYENARYILISSEENSFLPVLTNFSGSDLTTAINSEAGYFKVSALSPGSWGNGVGYRVRNVDYGRQTTKEISLSRPLVAGNEISISADGVTIGPVAFDTDHATTMANLFNALNTALSSRGILVKMGAQDWSGALNPDTRVAPSINTLTIAFRHREFGQDFALSASLTGDNAPNSVVNTLVTPDEISGFFTIEVFFRSNPSQPVESYRVTLHENVNQFGEETNISYQINEGPSASNFIRVYQPEYTRFSRGSSDLARFAGRFADDAQTNLNVHDSIQWLGGGADGASVPSSRVVSAFGQFTDRERYPVSYLINLGYSTVDVQKRMVSVCEERGDCFAILDVPSNRQTLAAAKNYSDFEVGINTSQAAMFTPDIQVQSEFSPGGRFVPPSGDVAARYAERHLRPFNEGAAAGIQFGRIPRANRLRHGYSQNDVGSLIDSNINPIILKANNGAVIWGARTMRRTFGPLSFSSIRVDLNQIERQIVRSLDAVIYRANTEFTRFDVQQSIETLLTSYRRANFIDFFQVVVSDLNNQEYHEANGQLNIDIVIRFVYPVEKIRLITTVTDTVITFEELQAA